MNHLNRRRNFTTHLAQVSVDQFKTLFQAAPVPLVEGVWGRSFDVLNANPAAIQLFGARSTEEFYNGFNALLSRMPPKVLLELLSARVRGNVFEAELRMPTFRRSSVYVFMRLAYMITSSAGPQHAILSFYDISAYKRQETFLKKLSQIDWLTKVFNQRTILERLDEEVDRAKRYELELSCVILDLDNFKQINDSFGHLSGDRVLRSVGQCIKECLRKTDVVGRYGGDEFLLILTETPAEQAIIPIRRFFKLFESKSQIKSKNTVIKTTFSAGISGFPGPGLSTPKDVMNAADQALYLSKTSGGNCCHLYQKKI